MKELQLIQKVLNFILEKNGEIRKENSDFLNKLENGGKLTNKESNRTHYLDGRCDAFNEISEMLGPILNELLNK